MTAVRGPAALAVVCAAWLAARLRTTRSASSRRRRADASAWHVALARYRARCAAGETRA